MRLLSFLGVLLGCTLMISCAKPVVKQAADLSPLLDELKSKSADQVASAFSALVAKQSDAIPILKRGLGDPQARLACVEILTKIPEIESAPVLIEAMQSLQPQGSREELFRCYIVGGLGRLKSKRAVAHFEKLYAAEQDKDSVLALSLAWALHEINGKDYGPSYDPWKQGK
jgi:HEAT repeat protein